MTEDLLKDFFTTFLERIRVYDYKLEIDSDVSGDHCEFSLFHNTTIVYNFWCSLGTLRVLVSDKFLVVDLQDQKYTDTIDLSLHIMDTMYPVLFKLGIVNQFSDLFPVIFGFKSSSWISFLTRFLDELGVKYYNYDGMIRTEESTVFVDEDKHMFYTSILGQEFFKEFKNDFDVLSIILDYLRNLIPTENFNVLTRQFVSPIEELTQESLDDSGLDDFSSEESFDLSNEEINEPFDLENEGI